VFGADLNNDIHDLIDQGIVVLLDAVSLDEGIDRDEAKFPERDCGFELFGHGAGQNGLAVLIKDRKLPGGLAWSSKKEPASDLGIGNVVVQKRRADAPPQLVAIIFERQNESVDPLKHVLAGDLSASDGGNDLGIPKRCLAHRAGTDERGNEASAECVAEYPLARWNEEVLIVAGIPS